MPHWPLREDEAIYGRLYLEVYASIRDFYQLDKAFRRLINNPDILEDEEEYLKEIMELITSEEE